MDQLVIFAAGSGSRRAKTTQKNSKNKEICFEVLHVLFWGLKASPVAWTTDVLSGCLGINALQFWIKKNLFFIYKVLVIKTLDLDPKPDPHWPKMLDPDPHGNQCGSETLVPYVRIHYFIYRNLWSVKRYRYRSTVLGTGLEWVDGSVGEIVAKSRSRVDKMSSN